MRYAPLVLALTVLAAPGGAQFPTAGPELETQLNFETEHPGKTPRGWGGGPPGTIVVDEEIVHGGRWSARLERTASSPDGFSTMTSALPVDFAGTTIEWRGFLRSDSVSDFFGLWLRQDGDAGAVAFDNMQKRQLKGTTGWTEYSITLPVHPDARQLFFGVLMSGTGSVWVDDLQLLVDGKPIWQAPKRPQRVTVLDQDHQFDDGSGIDVTRLSAVQIENLALTGRVWGFLKYHHPSVVGGKHHWDYELLRVLPKVLAADSREAGQAVLRDWVRALGSVAPCNPCVVFGDDNLHMKPDLDWIRQDAVVGRELAALLASVYQARPGGKQFFVSLAAGIGNPVFEHEPPYAGVKFPDAGYQLLALYRLWNIVEYWYPNRGILDQKWSAVLAEFIPRMALAKDKDSYQLETLAFIARITDTHSNLWSAPPGLRPPAGDCQLPLTIRFIENRFVVTGNAAATGSATGFQVGDEIERLDGVAVDELVARWSPFYPASNDAARRRDIARSLTKGACTTLRATVRRGSGSAQVTADRQPLASLNLPRAVTHDMPGETFRLLSDDVAYLKLSSVQADSVADYITRAANTKGLVIDIRNYPSSFVVFALGGLLVTQPTPFARFTIADLDNPGAFRWTIEPVSLMPGKPHYPGKVVILIDEASLSQAEYTAMAFRAAPQSIVVGSTTAGADGNVSPIPLPGGLRTMISGIGVFYPDKRPTQRIGIVPDVEVKPTIAGIRAGRDEVLEEALRQIRR
jgi:C-terminal processing protease CtpA/Prc